MVFRCGLPANMVSREQDAKLRFLQNAARRYAVTAPAVSTHLMAQRSSEAGRQDLALPTDSAHPFCAACGAILLPGLNAKVSITSGDRAHEDGRQISASTTGSTSKYIRLQCNVCHRFVKKPLAAQIKSRGQTTTSKSNGSRGTAKPATPKDILDEFKSPKNFASKQRAKARKGGLQALLDKSNKQTTSTPAQLNLMDLMEQD